MGRGHNTRAHSAGLGGENKPTGVEGSAGIQGSRQASGAKSVAKYCHPTSNIKHGGGTRQCGSVDIQGSIIH